MLDTNRISVGLEEGPDGAVFVHALSLPGCVAGAESRDAALEAFPDVLARWLHTLAALGRPVPPAGAELEVAVDEWIQSGGNVSLGESTVCFEADRAPLSAEEVDRALQLLGDLRGLLLARIRRLPDAQLDRPLGPEWTVRRALEELAREQWWLLTRLGSSPLGEVPARILGRLDTAMAMVVQQFTGLDDEGRAREVELEGEEWTPRKVLRRLLWVEFSLGRAVEAALDAEAP